MTALPVGTIVRQQLWDDEPVLPVTFHALDYPDDDDIIHAFTYARLDHNLRWRPCYLRNHFTPSKKVDAWKGHKMGFVFTTRNAKTAYFKDALLGTEPIHTQWIDAQIADQLDDDKDKEPFPCRWDPMDLDDPALHLLQQDRRQTRTYHDVIIYDGADFFIPGTFEWIPDYELKHRVHLKLSYQGLIQHCLFRTTHFDRLQDFVKIRFNFHNKPFRIIRADRTPVVSLNHRDTLIIHDATQRLIRRGNDHCVDRPHHNICTFQQLVAKRPRDPDDDDDDEQPDDQTDDPDYLPHPTIDRRGALRHLNQAIDSGKILTFFEQDNLGIVRVGCQFAGVSKQEAATFFQDIFSTRIREVILKEQALLLKRNKRNRN
jgi:hypothetical protein